MVACKVKHLCRVFIFHLAKQMDLLYCFVGETEPKGTFQLVSAKALSCKVDFVLTIPIVQCLPSLVRFLV